MRISNAFILFLEIEKEREREMTNNLLANLTKFIRFHKILFN